MEKTDGVRPDLVEVFVILDHAVRLEAREKVGSLCRYASASELGVHTGAGQGGGQAVLHLDRACLLLMMRSLAGVPFSTSSTLSDPIGWTVWISPPFAASTRQTSFFCGVTSAAQP